MEDANRIEGAWEDFLPLLQQDVESVEGKEALKTQKGELYKSSQKQIAGQNLVLLKQRTRWGS